MPRTTDAVDLAGPCASSQSGLPPPVREPAISYISLTAAVSPASGPTALPTTGAARSCGTKAERDRAVATAASELSSMLPTLSEIPVENSGAVPSDDPSVPEYLLIGALDVPNTVRHAGKIGVAGDRHDLRPLGRFFIEATELVESAVIHHLGRMML